MIPFHRLSSHVPPASPSPLSSSPSPASVCLPPLSLVFWSAFPPPVCHARPDSLNPVRFLSPLCLPLSSVILLILRSSIVSRYTALPPLHKPLRSPFTFLQAGPCCLGFTGFSAASLPLSHPPSYPSLPPSPSLPPLFSASPPHPPLHPLSFWKQMLFVRSYHYWLIKKTSLLLLLLPLFPSPLPSPWHPSRFHCSSLRKLRVELWYALVIGGIWLAADWLKGYWQSEISVGVLLMTSWYVWNLFSCRGVLRVSAWQSRVYFESPSPRTHRACWERWGHWWDFYSLSWLWIHVLQTLNISPYPSIWQAGRGLLWPSFVCNLRFWLSSWDSNINSFQNVKNAHLAASERLYSKTPERELVETLECLLCTLPISPLASSQLRRASLTFAVASLKVLQRYQAL